MNDNEDVSPVFRGCMNAIIPALLLWIGVILVVWYLITGNDLSIQILVVLTLISAWVALTIYEYDD